MDEPAVRHRHVRQELVLYLTELAADDPRKTWNQERQQGLASGIDEVFHFFFDDHDFDDTEIGHVFLDRNEAATIARVKRALDAVLQAVGDGDDDDFVQHPLWRSVTAEARAAQSLLSAAT